MRDRLQGFYAHMDAYNISSQSIELARRHVQAKGVENIFFHVGDLVTILITVFNTPIEISGDTVKHERSGKLLQK